MHAKIPVRDRQEADQLQRALERPDVRAFVIVIGALESLPNDRARKRVLTYVQDALSDPERAALPLDALTNVEPFMVRS